MTFGPGERKEDEESECVSELKYLSHCLGCAGWEFLKPLGRGNQHVLTRCLVKSFQLTSNDGWFGKWWLKMG